MSIPGTFWRTIKGRLGVAGVPKGRKKICAKMGKHEITLCANKWRHNNDLITGTHGAGGAC